MSSPPKISVVIPAYNATAFVVDAIRSVLAQPVAVELIVVDDGSTDGTAAEVAKFGAAVELVSAGRNEGLPSALNRGVERATGDLIGFLDADDLWQHDRLTWELELLAGTPADAIWGKTCVVFLDGNGGANSSPDWPPKHFPALGAMLFRRHVFARMGQFDPVMSHAQDIDFLARFSEAGLTYQRHDRVVLTWRRHERNMTNNSNVDRDYLVTAVRRALDRRRAAASAPAPIISRN
jgi:glycosyltransferase involved in cell wall biosynthesis